jgi:hypothetical protein
MKKIRKIKVPKNKKFFILIYKNYNIILSISGFLLNLNERWK